MTSAFGVTTKKGQITLSLKEPTFFVSWEDCLFILKERLFSRHVDAIRACLSFFIAMSKHCLKKSYFQQKFL